MNSEIKESSGMDEAVIWLDVNKGRLAIGAAIVLVVGFCIYLWNYLDEKKEADASTALLALRPTGSGTNQVPVPSGDFLKFASAHQGTAAAERAVYLAAGALFTEGKYSQAQQEFDNLIRNYPSGLWAPGATYGIAASLEAQGKRDEALTAYQRVITTYGTDSVANQARMSLARIYEAQGKPDLAVKQYEDLARPTPGAMSMSMAQQEAFMHRERIFRKHPELRPVQTNAPAMAPTMMSSTNLSVTIPSTNVSATNAPVKASATTNQPTPAAK